MSEQLYLAAVGGRRVELRRRRRPRPLRHPPRPAARRDARDTLLSRRLGRGWPHRRGLQGLVVRGDAAGGRGRARAGDGAAAVRRARGDRRRPPRRVAAARMRAAGAPSGGGGRVSVRAAGGAAGPDALQRRVVGVRRVRGARAEQEGGEGAQEEACRPRGRLQRRRQGWRAAPRLPSRPRRAVGRRGAHLLPQLQRGVRAGAAAEPPPRVGVARRRVVLARPGRHAAGAHHADGGRQGEQYRLGAADAEADARPRRRRRASSARAA